MCTVALVVDRRLRIVVARLVLSAIFLFTLKGSTWLNLVIFTYTTRKSGSGFRTGRCCRGKMGGSAARKATTAHITRGLSNILVGQPGCFKMNDGLESLCQPSSSPCRIPAPCRSCGERLFGVRQLAAAFASPSLLGVTAGVRRLYLATEQRRKCRATWARILVSFTAKRQQAAALQKPLAPNRAPEFD